MRLVEITGGTKRNAIPRECEATVFLPAKAWDDAAKTVAAFEAMKVVRGCFFTARSSVATTSSWESTPGELAHRASGEPPSMRWNFAPLTVWFHMKSRLVAINRLMSVLVNPPFAYPVVIFPNDP